MHSNDDDDDDYDDDDDNNTNNINKTVCMTNWKTNYGKLDITCSLLSLSVLINR